MRRYHAWLWGSVAAMGLALFRVAPLNLPDWVDVGLWSAWPVVFVFAFLSLTPVIKHVIAARTERRIVSTFIAILLGATVGGVTAPIILRLLPDDEPDEIAQKSSESTAAAVVEPAVAAEKGRHALVISRSAGPVMVIMSPLMPEPNQRPADPSDLELYFFALTGAAFGDKIQYAEATITNQSPRKMHLEIWGHVDYWKDSGEPARLGLKAEWNPDGLEEGTGQEFIDFDPWETKKGRLMLSLGKPEERGLSKWFLDASENVYFEAFDSVTGKRIAFKGMEGYPRGQMPAPLPSHKQLLALEFPALPATDPQSASTFETLELLFRTRNQMYGEGKWSVSAMFQNNSSERMELKVNLLNRHSPDETTWWTFEGRFNPRADGASEHKVLILEPNDTVDGSLIFADTGFTNEVGSQLNTNPKVSLFEISDSVSGKRVWCAIIPGYPPGTDMRSASDQRGTRAPDSSN